MTIEARPGAEYAVGMRVEKHVYVDYALVDSYIRSLNVLRPHRTERVWRWLIAGRDIRYSLIDSQDAPFRTRAQAAQAVWEAKRESRPLPFTAGKFGW